MEAGHMAPAGRNSIGINILLPFEQSASPIIAGDVKLDAPQVLLHPEAHVRQGVRRRCPVSRRTSGRQDEGFEVLTLIQTAKAICSPLFWSMSLEAITGNNGTEYIKRCSWAGA